MDLKFDFAADLEAPNKAGCDYLLIDLDFSGHASAERSASDGTSCNAALHDRPDDERLHRPETIGRGRCDGILACSAAVRCSATGSRRCESNGHRRFDGMPVRTKVCTNFRQTRKVVVNPRRDGRNRGEAADAGAVAVSSYLVKKKTR